MFPEFQKCAFKKAVTSYGRRHQIVSVHAASAAARESVSAFGEILKAMVERVPGRGRRRVRRLGGRAGRSVRAHPAARHPARRRALGRGVEQASARLGAHGLGAIEELLIEGERRSVLVRRGDRGLLRGAGDQARGAPGDGAARARARRGHARGARCEAALVRARSCWSVARSGGAGARGRRRLQARLARLERPRRGWPTRPTAAGCTIMTAVDTLDWSAVEARDVGVVRLSAHRRRRRHCCAATSRRAGARCWPMTSAPRTRRWRRSRSAGCAASCRRRRATTTTRPCRWRASRCRPSCRRASSGARRQPPGVLLGGDAGDLRVLAGRGARRRGAARQGLLRGHRRSERAHQQHARSRREPGLRAVAGAAHVQAGRAHPAHHAELRRARRAVGRAVATDGVGHGVRALQSHDRGASTTRRARPRRAACWACWRRCWRRWRWGCGRGRGRRAGASTVTGRGPPAAATRAVAELGSDDDRGAACAMRWRCA